MYYSKPGCGRQASGVALERLMLPETRERFSWHVEQCITVVPHTNDRYGRTVAMVFVDGRDVGLGLIRQGLAWAYEHYLPEASPEIQAQYSAAETAARVSRLGLWRDPEPQAPWEYRKIEKEQ